MNNHLPTDYQNFIALSRYARWKDDEQRRETWIPTALSNPCNGNGSGVKSSGMVVINQYWKRSPTLTVTVLVVFQLDGALNLNCM